MNDTHNREEFGTHFCESFEVENSTQKLVEIHNNKNFCITFITQILLNNKNKCTSNGWGVSKVIRTYVQIPWSKLYTENISSLSPSSMHFTCPYYSMYTRKEKIFPSPFTYVHSKVAPPLSLFSFYPLCFLTALCCDVTSQLFTRERGGVLGLKNPDLYYFKSN